MRRLRNGEIRTLPPQQDSEARGDADADRHGRFCSHVSGGPTSVLRQSNAPIPPTYSLFPEKGAPLAPVDYILSLHAQEDEAKSVKHYTRDGAGSVAFNVQPEAISP
jgi:hypothetical protein